MLGAPVGHSLSPVLHRAAYAGLGLDWSYEAIECDEQRLPHLLRALDDSWAGLSLTMPLKRAVLPLLDEVSELAHAVGGANTVVRDGARLRGDNTDVGGMLDAMGEQRVAAVRSAVVLGAGATACSTLAALRELAVRDVALVVRDPARTADVRAAADRLGTTVRLHPFAELPELLPTELVVSTLPSGAADRIADSVAAQPPEMVFDVCYDPWPTPLAAAAASAGSAVAGGFDLLLHQAVRQVTLMTGCTDVPVDEMRAAGEGALFARRG